MCAATTLTMFDHATEETFMAVEKRLERDSLGHLYLRQLEKSCLMKSGLALCHSELVHR